MCPFVKESLMNSPCQPSVLVVEKVTVTASPESWRRAWFLQSDKLSPSYLVVSPLFIGPIIRVQQWGPWHISAWMSVAPVSAYLIVAVFMSTSSSFPNTGMYGEISEISNIIYIPESISFKFMPWLYLEVLEVHRLKRSSMVHGYWQDSSCQDNQ